MVFLHSHLTQRQMLLEREPPQRKSGGESPLHTVGGNLAGDGLFSKSFAVLRICSFSDRGTLGNTDEIKKKLSSSLLLTFASVSHLKLRRRPPPSGEGYCYCEIVGALAIAPTLRSAFISGQSMELILRR